MKYRNTNKYPAYVKCGPDFIKIKPGELVEVEHTIHFPGIELVLPANKEIVRRKHGKSKN